MASASGRYLLQQIRKKYPWRQEPFGEKLVHSNQAFTVSTGPMVIRSVGFQRLWWIWLYISIKYLPEGLGKMAPSAKCFTSMKTWVQISNTYGKATCGRGDLKPQCFPIGATDKGVPTALWTDTLVTGQLQVQWNILFQEIKWRAAEDTWHWLMTSTCTRTHVYMCRHTHSCTQKFHFINSFHIVIRNCNLIMGSKQEEGLREGRLLEHGWKTRFFSCAFPIAWVQTKTCIFNINGYIPTSALMTYLIYMVAFHINYIINNGIFEKSSMNTIMSEDIWSPRISADLSSRNRISL